MLATGATARHGGSDSAYRNVQGSGARYSVSAKQNDSDEHSPVRIESTRLCSTEWLCGRRIPVETTDGRCQIHESASHQKLLCRSIKRYWETSAAIPMGCLWQEKEEKTRGPFSCFSVPSEPNFLSFSFLFRLFLPSFDLRVALRLYHLSLVYFRHGICKNQVAPPLHYCYEKG